MLQSTFFSLHYMNTHMRTCTEATVLFVATAELKRGATDTLLETTRFEPCLRSRFGEEGRFEGDGSFPRSMFRLRTRFLPFLEERGCWPRT